jgi:hypothetical protein
MRIPTLILVLTAMITGAVAGFVVGSRETAQLLHVRIQELEGIVAKANNANLRHRAAPNRASELEDAGTNPSQAALPEMTGMIRKGVMG